MIGIITQRVDLPDYDLEAVLDGVTYTLRFRWNTRDSAWYMDIETPAGEQLQVGIRLVLNFPMGRRSVDPRMPKGWIIALDQSGQFRLPGISDLGDRVQLHYYDAAEVAAMKTT